MRKFNVNYRGQEIEILETKNEHLECFEYSYKTEHVVSTPIFDTDIDAIKRAKEVIDCELGKVKGVDGLVSNDIIVK